MAKTFAHQRCLNDMQIVTGNNFSLEDATGTPQVSPLSYTTAEVEIKIPTNAVEIVIRPTTNIRIKKTTGGTSYYTLPANTTEVFGVAQLAASGGSIFFIREAASGLINFRFITL